MSRKPKHDPLAGHQEWVDHMYNPGYWVNRISWANLAHWRWVRRHNRLAGLIILLTFGLPLLLAAQTAWNAVEQDGLVGLLSDPQLWGYLLLWIVLTTAGLVLFFQRPLPETEPADHPVRLEKKKRHPKRRKDYR